MSERKKKTIEELLVPILKKSKAIQEELKKGERVDLETFLRAEMKEMSANVFHGISHEDYVKRTVFHYFLTSLSFERIEDALR